MLILTTPEAIRHAVGQYTASLPIQALERYAALIETEPIAWLFIIQPGDRCSDLEAVRARPFSAFEFIDSDGAWFEAVFIINDDGFGHIVLIPDQPQIDQNLLAACRHALAEGNAL